MWVDSVSSSWLPLCAHFVATSDTTSLIRPRHTKRGYEAAGAGCAMGAGFGMQVSETSDVEADVSWTLGKKGVYTPSSLHKTNHGNPVASYGET